MTSADWLKFLPEQTRNWLDGREIEQVDCLVSDIAGNARGKTIAAAKFSGQEKIALPDSLFHQTITGSYIDTGEEDQNVEADMVLTPEFSTAIASPWAKKVTVQVIHNVSSLDGEPVNHSPRNVLKRVLSFYEHEGWQAVVAPELEFYLTRPNLHPSEAIEPYIGRNKRNVVKRQAYSLSALDEYGAVIDEIQKFAEAQGIDMDGVVQEDGAGQIEINLQHGCPLALADQVFHYKRTVREAALRHDCFATFMAKPMQAEPGSAMHIHQSIVDTKTGDNIFSQKDGSPTQLFYAFIAGQQQHLPSVFCLTAPYANSYRRFVEGFSAPVNLEWGDDNRTTGLRIPQSSPQARRVENRIIGMDCNPYLAIAACLASGFIGMKNALKPRDAIIGEAYKSDLSMPKNLAEALKLFAPDSDVTELLGNDFCQLYRSIKKTELNEFDAVITAWEREHLLLNV